MAAADIARGQKVAPPIPDSIMEYFLLKEFPGWTLDYIRSLSNKDFQVLVRIATTTNRVEAHVQDQQIKKSQSQTRKRR